MEGNQMEMRRALDRIFSRFSVDGLGRHWIRLNEWDWLSIKTAISAPSRNCDVGTPEEQAERYFDYCKRYPMCEGCPHCAIGECALAWGQMPYEAKQMQDMSCETITKENGTNSASLRYALELLNKLFDRGILGTHSEMTADEMDEVDELYFKTKAALAKPPRNCDRPECQDVTSAQWIWAKEDGGKTAFYEWLLATAEQKG